MSFAHLATCIISVAVLTTIGGIFSVYLRKSFLSRRIESASDILFFNYLLVSVVLTFTFLGAGVFPHPQVFYPLAKVWVAPTAKSLTASYSQGASGTLTLVGVSPVSTLTVVFGLEIFMGVLAFTGILILGWNTLKLRRLLKHSLLFKSYGSVDIYLSEGVRIPFSFWWPGKNIVVIPTLFSDKPAQLKMVVLHELQHHRQHDTKWLYLMLAVQMFCFWNPFVHLWMKYIHEFQEYACDEALVGRKKVSSKAYASCLLWVAETAVGRGPGLACAAGLSFSADRQSLKRRIEKMLSEKPRSISKLVSIGIALFIVGLCACAAWGTQGLVQDRQVSLEQAHIMKMRAKADGFPIVVNDLVLKELNRYLGTPDGREFMRLAVQRMANYKAMIERKLKEQGVPLSLAAIPIIESGYQNLAQSANPSWGAGLWMFIESTARNYGLRVDEFVDQRLNVELETDAATRYLVANDARFNDWALSVLAYNAGESAVQEAIDKEHSRDPWALVRSGVGNEASYLPRLMAAVLIMQNASVLK